MSKMPYWLQRFAFRIKARLSLEDLEQIQLRSCYFRNFVTSDHDDNNEKYQRAGSLEDHLKV